MHSGFIEQLWSLARPANFSLPLLQILIGYEIAGGSVFVTNYQLYGLIIVAFLSHSAVTLDNDLADRDIDKDNNVDTIITKGDSAHRQKIRRSVMFLYAATVIGAFLLPSVVTYVVLLMTIGGVLYNHRPLRLSRRPFGSIITLGILYGMVPLVAGYVLYAGIPVPLTVVAIILFWGVCRAGLSLLKDFKDATGDKAHGKLTFLLAFGRKNTLIVSTVLSLVGMVALAVLVAAYVAPVYTLLCVCTSVFIIGIIAYVRVALLRTNSYVDRLFHKLLYLQLVFDGALLLWLTI